MKTPVPAPPPTPEGELLTPLTVQVVGSPGSGTAGPNPGQSSSTQSNPVPTGPNPVQSSTGSGTVSGTVGSGAAPRKRPKVERLRAKNLYVSGLEVDGQIRWLSMEELAEYLGVPVRSLKKQSVRESWVKLRNRTRADAEAERHRKRAEKHVQAEERLQDVALMMAQQISEELARATLKASTKRNTPVEKGGDPDYVMPEKTISDLVNAVNRLVSVVLRLIQLKEKKALTETDTPATGTPRDREADEATLALAAKLEQMTPEQSVRWVEAVLGPSPAGDEKIEGDFPGPSGSSVTVGEQRDKPSHSGNQKNGGENVGDGGEKRERNPDE